MRTAILLLCAASCAAIPLPLTPPKAALDISPGKMLGTRVPDADVTLPEPQRLEMQPRTASGEFILRPGYYVMDVPSFCLHPGRAGSSTSSQFVPAPVGGPSGAVVKGILKAWGKHRGDVTQQEVQSLIWAVAARKKLSEASPSIQRVAKLLISAKDLAGLEDTALEVMSASVMKQLQAKLPPKAREILELQNKLRGAMSAATSFEELEAIAVPPSMDYGPSKPVWVRRRDGLLVRYLTEVYSETRIEVLVEGPITVGGLQETCLVASTETTECPPPREEKYDPQEDAAADSQENPEKQIQGRGIGTPPSPEESAGGGGIEAAEAELLKFRAYVRSLRKWHKEDTEVMRKAICEMREAANDNSLVNIEAAKILARFQCSVRNHYFEVQLGAERVRVAIAAVSATDDTTARKVEELNKEFTILRTSVGRNLNATEGRGAASPPVRTLLESGNDEHEKYQGKPGNCDHSEVPFIGADGKSYRMDCVKGCTIIEIKPKGDTGGKVQVKNYTDQLVALTKTAREAQFVANPALKAALEKCVSGGKLKLDAPRVVYYELCPKKTWEPATTWEE